MRCVYGDRSRQGLGCNQTHVKLEEDALRGTDESFQSLCPMTHDYGGSSRNITSFLGLGHVGADVEGCQSTGRGKG